HRHRGGRVRGQPAVRFRHRAGLAGHHPPDVILPVLARQPTVAPYVRQYCDTAILVAYAKARRWGWPSQRQGAAVGLALAAPRRGVRPAFAARRHVMLLNAGDGWGTHPMTLSCVMRTVRTLHPPRLPKRHVRCDNAWMTGLSVALANLKPGTGKTTSAVW